ncbi:hypothetical protein GCM10025865_12830 [Paraoerskovia sediminicola]|uniref:YbaK/aminoacyl-tRNA synthetase-associated domain-containing protein n=1 Tax=Paraoerskovia sediminicola TaxID=1138587 RepID=A0ABM8G1Y4_9CELL|nr:YbaK/EbsC family protein [Paraoerskovia sediminicola]BDZ41984.1 hypothetical protein GCM10025865_12830 [Paraoerskovia sediminicola]
MSTDDLPGQPEEPHRPDRALADAAARGLEVELVDIAALRGSAVPGPGTSTGEADAWLGVKTLVVRVRDGEYLLALVPIDRVLSWKRLRTVVGVNRLHKPAADVALAATGYESGTITPLGAQGGWPVVADERLAGRVVMLGSGVRGTGARVDGDALLAAYGATVADVSDAPPSDEGQGRISS